MKKSERETKRSVEVEPPLAAMLLQMAISRSREFTAKLKEEQK